MITYGVDSVFGATVATGRFRNGLPLRRVIEPIPVFIFGYPLLTIPVGFESDGTSLPRFARLFWKDGWREDYAGPALLHDYLLEHSDFPKSQIDWLYQGALRSNDVSALETGIFWLAVRTREPGKH